MKSFITTIIVSACILLAVGCISSAQAGEIDLLLQKLVEKGVITAGEAQQIGTETKEQVKKEIAKGTYSSLPAWVQNTKLKGDFRLRLQNNHPKVTGNTENERLRARLRLRLGLESKVNDKLLVAFGLATGTTDATSYDAARSTNQSFQDSFAKKAIDLDYAYVKYAATPWATLTGGKMKFLPWEPTDLIWDTDITPEGAAVELNKKLNDKTSVFMNTAGFVIDELSSESSDPVMYVIQPGMNYQFTDRVALKGAFAYYDFSNIKGRILDGSQGTNTRTSGPTGLMYNFRPINPALEINIKQPFKGLGVSFLDIPSLSLFGEYVHNLAISESKNRTGFSTGFKFGAEKIAGWGDWDVKYIYAQLEKDAVPDILPDSDRYSGKTGVRSHEIMVNYGLGKNTSLSFDMYRSWSLLSSDAPETIVQVDWNMKF
jgi:hypothetical protein